MRRLVQPIILLLITFQIFSCASIPKEGSELSLELGKRLSAIEGAHLALLHRYMDLKRARVDEFIENEWTPTFADSYLSKPKIREMWTKVNQEGDAKDKLKFFTIVATEAQKEISKKRLELIAPLDEAERLIERKLKDEYAQTKAMNAAITGLLASASEVSEAGAEMFKTFGIRDEHLTKLVSGIDTAVAALDKVENAAKRFETFKIEIEKAVNELKKIK